MEIRQILLPLGLAVTLFVMIPSILLPAFYIIISPLAGCRPVGNVQNLFSTQVFQGPQIEATCPPKNTNVYMAILAYMTIITIAVSIALFAINKGFVIIILGAFLPYIYFGLAGAGMSFQGGQQIINILGVIIIGIGVIISWMMK